MAEAKVANLIRFEPGDPRAAEAGRRGARVANERRRAERLRLDERLEELVEREADRIAAVFDEVLALKPDPAWASSTKLDFYTRQINQLEKLLDRVVGKPERRESSPDPSAVGIPPEIDSMPAPLVRELLRQALGAGAARAAAPKPPSAPFLEDRTLDSEEQRDAHEHP